MGRTEEAISGLKQGLNAIAGAGTLISHSAYLCWLAEAHLNAGEPEEGLEALAQAMTHVNETGERFWEAELYRIKGKLLLLPGGSPVESEESFQQALDVARGQQARPLELRAAMSLARLWQNLGKAAEACELLGGIYGWFTEGFGTPDLIEARLLLGELS